jgi:superfamily I DNA and/or RNA helicase
MYKIHKNKSIAAELANVFVTTIDGFQGGERALVLFDITGTKRIGFMYLDPRVNVALSRAKCGSSATWTKAVK